MYHFHVDIQTQIYGARKYVLFLGNRHIIMHESENGNCQLHILLNHMSTIIYHDRYYKLQLERKHENCNGLLSPAHFPQCFRQGVV